ncbi:unnamed protein product, partial [Mesorhabditis belari]|uniref:Amino acid transporter transmembrane domain-containing protein n=1 Tax=Mesorhabditis belari TaxID=2138241 RepID=A0AAF3J507_9BILA
MSGGSGDGAGKPLMLGVNNPFAENPSMMTLAQYQDTCIPVSMEFAKSKMHWIIAAIFLVADMVGGGVVVMPVAFKQSGMMMGCLFMVVICVIFEYTGWELGQVWVIMQERWPLYKQHCRKPFPEMAKKSMGTMAQRLTSAAILITLFGISVVYLLLSANIIHYFLYDYLYIPISLCGTIVVLALLISPFTLLKSPGDFWIVVVFAMVTTVLSVAMIIYGIFLDHGACAPQAKYSGGDSGGVLFAMGTFLFAFSGHYVFPTIVNDMRHPKKFSYSIAWGFLVVLLLYMPLSVYAYFVYGDSMEKSVIYSVQTRELQFGANLMIAAHCILTLVIVINPVNQEVEEYFNIPHKFGIGRVLVRMTILLFVLFTGLTMPDFGPVMNLVGSSTIPLGCVVMPALFYLWINAATEEQWGKGVIPSIKQVYQRTPKIVFWLNIFVMGVALVGGAVGSYKAVIAMIETEFSAPCYFRGSELLISKGNTTIIHMVQTCCGWAKNISSKGTPDLCGEIPL